ncbi:MAG: hypothetical protein QM730_18835 [Anaerolineales bacterium]
MMTTTLNGKSTQEIEIAKVEKLLKEIADEQCWGARLSVGNELRLEFGTKLPNLNLRGKQKGVWRLGTGTSHWAITMADEHVVDSYRESLLVEEIIKLLDGKRVKEFKIDWSSLNAKVLFNAGIRLDLFPNLKRRSRLHHWELFMPDSMLLRIGPSQTWSLVSSKEIVQ